MSGCFERVERVYTTCVGEHKEGYTHLFLPFFFDSSLSLSFLSLSLFLFISNFPLHLTVVLHALLLFFVSIGRILFLSSVIFSPFSSSHFSSSLSLSPSLSSSLSPSLYPSLVCVGCDHVIQFLSPLPRNGQKGLRGGGKRKNFTWR